MNVEPCELGSFRPVSDLQVLAAVERAHRHDDRVPRDCDTVPHWDIARHLGFKHNAATTRRLRPMLEALHEDGSLATERRRRTHLYALTARGRGRLAVARRQGALEPLPESPQHRTWRHARETATDCIEEVCGAVLIALGEADEVLGGSEKSPGDSTRHFEAGERLGRQFRQLGIAIHCLREWPEPDDARCDVDPDARRHGRRWYYGLKERSG